MGYSVEVNSSNYATEVIEKSYEKLVIVDFFATWCGPCQILKPILEKLAKEYDFVLAKVDIDRSPELANKFGIEGVPDVKIVKSGEMLSGFVGVLPEQQLRELLDKLNLKSKIEIELESIREAKAVGDLKQAKKILDRLFEEYPDNSALTIEAAKFLINLNQLEAAEKMLNTVKEDDREFYAKAVALKGFILLQKETGEAGETEIDRKYSQAINLALEEKYESALELFLDIVTANRKYKNDAARKAMLSIFNLLGSQHPLTKQYQQHLMLALY
jgi:putative thioredoxin